MATYLFAWELGSGLGHCVNLMPVAAGLLARGHTVYVVARDLTTTANVFGELPVRYLQSPYFSARLKLPIAAPRTFAHILLNTCCSDQSQFDLILAAWRNIFDLVRPAVVVCEHAPMALIASRFYPIRRVVIGTGFFSPPNIYPLPDLRPWLPADVESLQRDEQIVLDRINQALSANGRPALSQLAKLFAETDENILLTFEELDHYGPRPTAEYWGMWSPNGGEEPTWPDGPGQRLFAYLKSPISEWKPESVLSAINQLDVSALVYLPNASDEFLEQYTTPRIRILTSRIDILQIAQQCDVAVLNGNAGTATELLRAGVPLLNIPIFLEQTIFSLRVAKSGMGLVAQASQPNQIAAHLPQLLHSSKFRDSATEFSKRYASYEPEASVEQILYRLNDLAARRPVRRTTSPS